MSHYQVIKSQLRERRHIMAAIESAGLEAQIAPQGQTIALKDWRGNTAGHASIVFDVPVRYGGSVKIGLVENKDGSWSWAGDGDYLYDSSPKSITGKIAMWAAAHEAKELVESQGHHMSLSLDAATGLVLGEYTMEVSA